MMVGWERRHPVCKIAERFAQQSNEVADKFNLISTRTPLDCFARAPQSGRHGCLRSQPKIIFF